MTAAGRLEAAARRWRITHRALAAVIAAAGLAAALVAWRSVLPVAPRAVLAVAALVIAAWQARRRWRAGDADPLAVARHLDTALPELERSTALLLRDEGELGVLERLQRARLEARLDACPRLPLPEPPWRAALATAGLLVGAAGLVSALARPGAPVAAVNAPDRVVPASAAVPLGRVAGVEVTVQPPAYAGLPARTARDWSVEALAGSRVRWTIRTDGAVGSVALATSDGDTIVARAAGDDRWTADLVATHSLLYQPVLARGTDRRGGDYARLAVRADLAPRLVVVEPAERTILPADGPGRVAVLVLADDDLGIASTELVATITTGRGEAVTFREARLPFATERRRERHALALRATLDLRALGLGPGDELYFHARALDRRTPEPNEGRSETVFLAIADTAPATRAEAPAIALDVSPEYFRSQRQVIIDTEKLLAEQRAIPRATFEGRSHEIGVDQGILRLRYGELVGDEAEGALAGEGHEAEHADDPDAEAAADPSAAFVHRHDTEENATRLAQSVKATLKDVVAQMFEAEKRLRTFDPRGALPYEYRALELLKQVQQSARSYVQRVGFAPPPIEVAKLRLTGDLDGIAPGTASRPPAEARPLPEVRRALALLASDSAPPAAALEAAGRSLAARAVREPGSDLEVLGALRAALDTLATGHPLAPAQRAVLAARLWRALPAAPDDLPRPGTTPSAAGAAYLRALTAPR